MKGRYLVVGHGTREAAMSARLASEFNEVSAFTIHENHSLDQICGLPNVTLASSYDPDHIIAVAKKADVDIIVPGHEAPLYAGLADKVLNLDIHVFGPTQAVCRLETDKTFSRAFAKRVDRNFSVWAQEFFNSEDALAFIGKSRERLVLKCWDSEKQNYQTHMLSDENDISDDAMRSLIEVSASESDAFAPILLEECIDGPDFSIYVVSDGVSHSLSPPMQDFPFIERDGVKYKTGGMGCISGDGMTLPFLSPKDYQSASLFIANYLKTSAEELGPLKGMYSFQFFKSNNGLKFNEVDVRPGDPEMVNYLSLLTSRFDKLINGVCNGPLEGLTFSNQACVSICLSTPGYPLIKDTVQYRLDLDEIRNYGCEIYFGQSQQEVLGTMRSIGSRAAVLSSKSSSIPNARKKIVKALSAHRNLALHYRDDIGLENDLNRPIDLNSELDMD